VGVVALILCFCFDRLSRNSILFEFELFRSLKRMIIGRNADTSLNAYVKENNSTHWCREKKL
jgi:hypothetical protein